MKRQCLIVLTTVAAMIIGLGSLASVRGSDIVLSIPGFTIVQDAKDDLLLRRCDPDHPNLICSLPPGGSLPTLPGYFDIKNAKIIQHGRKYVDLFIALYEPIPSPGPPYPFGFVNYFWQFEGGCVEDQPGSKDGVRVGWDGSAWAANWYVITDCDPRRAEAGDPVPFEFTNDGVKVRVTLEELAAAVDLQTGQIKWHAGVRRIPFIYHPDGYPEFPYTTAVDYAPDVIAFIDCGDPPTPPCFSNPETPATWEPR